MFVLEKNERIVVSFSAEQEPVIAFAEDSTSSTAYTELTRPNREDALESTHPIAIIGVGGFAGLVMVMAYARGWANRDGRSK